MPRKNSFPTILGGKASDTGLVMRWLASELHQQEAMAGKVQTAFLNPKRRIPTKMHCIPFLDPGKCWYVWSTSAYRVFTCEVGQQDELFQLCVYLVKCTNKFFRFARSKGILITNDDCTILRTAGYEMNAIQIT